MTDDLSIDRERLLRKVSELTDELAIRPADVEYSTAWNATTIAKTREVLETLAEKDVSEQLQGALAGIRRVEEHLDDGWNHSSQLPSGSVAEIGWMVARIAIGAALGAGLGGPYIAMTLHQEVAGKVVEGAIGGFVGALANEVGNALTGPPVGRDQRARWEQQLNQRIRALEGKAEVERTSDRLQETLRDLESVREALDLDVEREEEIDLYRRHQVENDRYRGREQGLGREL